MKFNSHSLDVEKKGLHFLAVQSKLNFELNHFLVTDAGNSRLRFLECPLLRMPPVHSPGSQIPSLNQERRHMFASIASETSLPLINEMLLVSNQCNFLIIYL